MSLVKFQTHVRVVNAMVLREMESRYGDKFGGYIWAILEPVGFIALLSIVFSTVARVPLLGSSFPLFYASGYLIYNFYTSIANVVGSAVSTNRALLNYPIVTPYDAYLARLLLQLLTASTAAILIVAGIALFQGLDLRLIYENILTGVVLASLLGLGVGMINSLLFEIVPIWKEIFRIISAPLFLISGIFFIPEALPQSAQNLIYFNPLAHIIAWGRSGFYPEYSSEFIDRFAVLFTVMSVVLIGLVVTSKFKHRLARK
jgi:capsular polysaccharide transport system permease protein